MEEGSRDQVFGIMRDGGFECGLLGIFSQSVGRKTQVSRLEMWSTICTLRSSPV